MTKLALIVTKNRKEGVLKALELLGLNPVQGKNVVLKPNFNTADPPPASTHIDTLETIVQWIQEKGAKSILLAERSGPASTAEAFEKVGAVKLAEKYGFKLLNLQTAPEDEYTLLKPEDSHWKDGFLFSKTYKEAECIVETCCLKTHKYGGHFTLSMKNAVGLVPRDNYEYMKELHSSEHQRKMIAEINAVYKPDLIIMDGIVTFVDGGPMEGTRKDGNVIIAGTDKIAIDAVGVAILRILGTTAEVSQGAVFDQEQIARAVELGIGVQSPDQIEFLTDSPEGKELVSKIKSELGL